MKIKRKIYSFLAIGMMISSLGVSSNAEFVNIERYSGKDRVETSINTIEGSLENKSLVIVDANSYADSLSAINILNSENAKLLLTNKESDLNFLENKKVSKIYIVGGNVKEEVISKAKKISKNVVTLNGRTRYDTNKKTLEYAGFNKIGVADGRNFADALSAAPLLRQDRVGLMLVDGSKPYKTNKTVFYTFGSKDSVKQDGGVRLGGKNRYETNMIINRKIEDAENIIVASGENFADALSSLNLMGEGLESYKDNKNVIVLTSKNKVAKDAVKIANWNKGKKVIIVGGKNSISDLEVDEILNKEAVKKEELDNKNKEEPSDIKIITSSKDSVRSKDISSSINISSESNDESVKTPSEIEKSINKFLKGPLKNRGDLVVRLSNKYGLDPAFVTAIMGAETGFGGNIRHRNNPMSVMYNRHGKSTYPTIEAGVEAGIRNIATNRAYRGKNFNSFANTYLGYSDSNYKGTLNHFYKRITGKSIYSVRIR